MYLFQIMTYRANKQTFASYQLLVIHPPILYSKVSDVEFPISTFKIFFCYTPPPDYHRRTDPHRDIIDTGDKPA